MLNMLGRLTINNEQFLQRKVDTGSKIFDGCSKFAFSQWRESIEKWSNIVSINCYQQLKRKQTEINLIYDKL